jgi:hypothetical protein
MSEAVFRSARGALMFAFNFTHGTLKKSALAGMMGASPNGRGLGGLDGAAQAGMIKAEVDHLPELHQAILIARYTPPVSPCACGRACCRGSIETPEWGRAVNWLTEYVLLECLVGTVSRYRLRRTLVMRYFGQKIYLVATAELCGVNKNTASAQNQKVTERLRHEERLAEYAIEGVLKSAGIVENLGVAA